MNYNSQSIIRKECLMQNKSQDQKKQKPISFKFTTRNKYSKYLVCKICSNLMIQPQRLYPCGHTFCRQCILKNDEKTSQKRCFIQFPDCGKFYIVIQPDLMASHLIQDLQVQCINQDCLWVGSLQRFKKNHSSQCKFKDGLQAWLKKIKESTRQIQKAAKQRLHKQKQIVQIQDNKVYQQQQNSGNSDLQNLQTIAKKQGQQTIAQNSPVKQHDQYKIPQIQQKTKQKHKKQLQKQQIIQIDQQNQTQKGHKQFNKTQSIQQKYTKNKFINSYKNKFHKIIQNPYNMNLTRCQPKNKSKDESQIK